MAQTTLYLVRHGEQDPTAAHTTHGGLSDLGRQQAHLLGQRLRQLPLAALHHSPLPRAAQTADVIAGYLPHVPAHACEHAADRTPVPSPAARHEYPDRYLPWLDTVPDDQRDEDAARIRAAVGHLGTTGDDDRHELVVTHNFVIGWFVRHALDAPAWRWLTLDQDNCAMTVIRWETGRPARLVSFNDVGHLSTPHAP